MQEQNYMIHTIKYLGIVMPIRKELILDLKTLMGWYVI